MKIRISHIPNTFNTGSLMMAVNVIEYIAQRIPEAEFFTDAVGDIHIDRIKKSVKATNKIFGITPNNSSLEDQESNSGELIVKKKLQKHKLIYRVTKKLYMPLWMTRDLIKLIGYSKDIKIRLENDQCETIIVLGGDDLSPYYGLVSLLKHLIEIKIYSSKRKVFLIGQTIGPFKSPLRKLVKYCLKDAFVFTRDNPNYRYARDVIGLSKLKMSSDLAYLDLPYQNDKDIECEILKRFSLSINEYIVIVPSGLVEAYTVNRNDYIQNYLKTIRYLIEKFKDKIVLLDHVIYSDRKVIEEIYTKLTQEEKNKVIKITEELLPAQIRAISGNGKFTITGRMHSAVSTFQKGKPAISISYSIKYDGVIGDELGMGELIVDGIGKDKWSNGYVFEKIQEKIQYIEENYSQIHSKVSQAIEGSKTKSYIQIEEIIKGLK